MKALGAEVVRAPSAPFGTPGKKILSLQKSGHQDVWGHWNLISQN